MLVNLARNASTDPQIVTSGSAIDERFMVGEKLRQE